ncbi:MAG: hypothetical protein DRP06_03820 [Candidatus Aenigmatarchaeota archaeon]|nr:MAG: hypothetical protein DRP06_03820 [Candidatus Aenigmarchaeota archaeon]
MKIWIFLIIFIFFLFLIPKASAEQTWWNSSWLYRKPINITEQSGNTLIEYPFLITINTASLISQGKMNSDCSDIRFTDENDNEIPYWIESGCNSENTIIWIKVPSIPANSNTTIYVYYGNPNAISESNWRNIFEDLTGTWSWNGTHFVSTYAEEHRLKLFNLSNFEISFNWSYLGCSDIQCIFAHFWKDSDGVWGGSNYVSYSVAIEGDWSLWKDSFATRIGGFAGGYPCGTKNELFKLREYGSYHVQYGSSKCSNGCTLTDSTYNGVWGWFVLRFYAVLGNVIKVSVKDIRLKVLDSNGNDVSPTYIIGNEETTPIPQIRIYSPLNQTHIYFGENFIQFKFKVFDFDDETIHIKTWHDSNLIYDNDSYINNTLITLSLIKTHGTHYVKVWANDSSGNEVTETVYYSNENFSDWRYRRPIIITEQSGNNLTNYQIAINISYDSDMNSNFSDLRFTWYNKTYGNEIKIPYYIENKVDESWAYVWIKVPSIPANSNTTIYVYYGNPNAISESNSKEVFDIWDNFSVDTIGSDWISIGSGSWVIEDGILKGGTFKNTRQKIKYIKKTFSTTSGYYFESRFQHSNYTSLNDVLYATFYSPDNISNYLVYYHWKNADPSYLGRGGNPVINCGEGSNLNGQTWYRFKVYTWGTNYKIEVYDDNWNLLCSSQDSSQTHSTGTLYFGFGGYGTDPWFDYIIVRKYTYPEPTYSIEGEEIIILSCHELNNSNVNYYLFQDITTSITQGNCINITAENITLDCQGHWINRTGSFSISPRGIMSYNNSVTITNCKLSNWGIGIGLGTAGISITENTIRNSSVYNSYIGIYATYTSTSTIENVTVKNNTYGIYPYSNTENITLKDSRIESNDYGLFVYWFDWGEIPNIIVYNNIFNNSENFYIYQIAGTSYFNVTKQPGTNIWNSSLGYIGGNYWAKPDGTGYSESWNCKDFDFDGFCDSPYQVISGYYDYLPIAKAVGFNYYRIIKGESAYIPKKCRDWGISGIHQCRDYCPDCYSEIGFKVPWYKTVTINNTGTYTAYNISVNATIPISVVSINDIELLDPDNEYHDFYANISAGFINWTVEEIQPAETQVWTINFYTTPPTISESNQTVGTSFTKWQNISGAVDLNYEKVWDYTYLEDPSIFIRFYDNTSGDMTEVTSNSEWGPPVTRDLNNNGFDDYAQWIVPIIGAGQTKQIVITSTVAEASCEVINKTILNYPVPAGENVQWRWTILCYNQLGLGVNYKKDLRIPLESTQIYLDDIPIEPGFLIVPPYGPYVEITGSLGPYENETHILEFITPGVTVDVSPPLFPNRMWVGQMANLILDITVKNWATQNISKVIKKINIGYGENVTVYLEGYEVDRVDLVKGYYELNITNLTAGEARSYQIIFKSPTAEAIAGKYSGRRIINGTQYLMYPIYVKSVAAFPLTNLSMRLEVSDPFKCYDLKFCWLTDKDTYLNPPKGEELDLDCEDSKTAILDIGELSVGGEKYITCFLREKERPAPVLPDIYNFFDWLINAIKNFINWLIGLFG